MMKTLCCDISTRKLCHGMLPSLFLPPKLHMTDVGLKPPVCYAGRASGFMIQLPVSFILLLRLVPCRSQMQKWIIMFKITSKGLKIASIS